MTDRYGRALIKALARQDQLQGRIIKKQRRARWWLRSLVAAALAVLIVVYAFWLWDYFSPVPLD
jgi:hypothetical protein